MKWKKKLLWVCSILFSSCASSKFKDVSVNHPYIYALPFGGDSYVRVYQGWRGNFSHSGAHEYALDFGLSKKQEVLAAREGKVIAAVDVYYAGGNHKDLLDKANYVLIEHDDQTFAEYYHLHPNSAQVQLGDRVKRGQLLALSGDTGYATVAHLHFMVFYRDIISKNKISIPIVFETDRSKATMLIEGEVYKNSKSMTTGKN